MFQSPSDTLLLPIGLAVLLATLLLVRAVRRLRARRRRINGAKPVIIDGSNVMHWDGGKPRIAVVRSVVDLLKTRGYTPGVVFDANAGYLLTGRYQHDGSLSRALGLPEKNVMVVPKGTPADPMILQVARDMGACVISNDRFRDWDDQFPEIRRHGVLIRGSFRSGNLNLKLPSVAAQAPRQIKT